MVKLSSILVYLTACMILIMTLTMSTGASAKIISWFEEKINKADIEEVIVELDKDELLAGSSYRPTYTPVGDIDGDAGLVFTSLNPEYLTVSSNGVLSSKKTFDGDVLDAKIKITSKYDKDFEQIVSFSFIKRYPESFSVSYYLRGYGYGSKSLYLGIPVYVISSVTSNNNPNMTDYEIIYDEEYFEKQEDGGFIPIKATLPGEKIEFSVRYGNGMVGSSSQFDITEPLSEISDIDEIRVENKSDDFLEIKARTGLGITLYSNGQKVASDYTVTFDDDTGIKKSKAGNPILEDAGEKLMTITAPNGFSKTVRVKVVNIIHTPVLVDTEVAQSRYIELLDTDVKQFIYTIEKGATYENVTYEYDKDIIQVTSDSRSFKITGKNAGTTTLKMVIDDGVTRIEESYTVKVEKDTRISKLFEDNLTTFVPKVLGHCLAFVFLAFFAMNMFKHFDIPGYKPRFPLYTFTGLWVAVITELIQFFMSTRDASLTDILIDMIGFYIGTLIVVIIRACRGEE